MAARWATSASVHGLRWQYRFPERRHELAGKHRRSSSRSGAGRHVCSRQDRFFRKVLTRLNCSSQATPPHARKARFGAGSLRTVLSSSNIAVLRKCGGLVRMRCRPSDSKMADRVRAYHASLSATLQLCIFFGSADTWLSTFTPSLL